jgi:DNA-directed RNA polymerase subunit RPC12/RpoP
MELVCGDCGYKIDVGGNLDPKAKSILVCSECGSKNVKLVDVGGINIKIDGINEDTIVHVIKELAKNVNVYDVFSFLAKQGQGKKKDEDDELDLGGK